MHIEFVGRGFTVTAKHRAHVTEYLQRIFPMIPNATGARIVLGLDKYRHIAEVELLGPAGDFVARCEGKDMDQALHDALQRVEQQVVHHNQRHQTIRGHQKPINSDEAEDRGVAPMLNAQ
jgi:putative sigma-54 modulation protein